MLGPASRVFTYVAETEQAEIVGFATGGPERFGDQTYRGELYIIYLPKSRQRKGVGKELTKAVGRRLTESGLRSMLVWVLAENTSARRFYEALGGEYVREQTMAIGGANLVEVAYGWKDIRTIEDPEEAQGS